MANQSPRDMREWMRNIERMAKRGNTAAASLVAKSPGGTVEGIEAIIDSNKKLTPAAPVELVVQTALYLSDDFIQRGRATVTFLPVTKAATGQDLLVDRYELWGQDLTAGALYNTTAPYPGITAPGLSYPGQGFHVNPAVEPAWVMLGTSPDPDVSASSLAVGSTWMLRVRAIGMFTVAPGLWSEEREIRVTADNTPPPQPTKPEVTSNLGTIAVRWDGMSVSGPMPSDFLKLHVAMGEAPSPEFIVTVFDGSVKLYVIPDAPYYQTQFFRFRAEDISGNLSDWSEQEVGVALPLVDTSQMEETLRLARAELDAAVSELDSKIAENEDALSVLDGTVGAVQGALNEVEIKADAAAANASAANTAAGEAQTAAGAAKADALAAVGIANGKGKVLVQPTAPGAGDRNTNTLWIDTTGGLNTPKRWVSGTQWQAVTDKVATDAAAAVIVAKNRADEAFNKAVDAATAAGNALTAANGKTRNWYQATKPAGTGHNVNDTWYQSPGNEIHRWNGSDWVSIQDTDIADAKQAAVDAEAAGNAADTKAVNAQNKADQAAADALAAQNAANAAATLASNVITTTTTVATGIPPAKNAMWVQTNAAGTLVIKTWTANAAGTAWVVSQLDDAVIGNLNAATINAGILNAARLNATDIRAKFLAAGKITAADITTGTLTSASGIFGTMDASVINAGTLNAARLNATDIRAKFLAAGKITAADMVAGTITATSGVIGSLDAAVIVAKSITGDKLAFNTISTRNLAVGAFDNVIPDPTFSNSSEDWGSPGAPYSFPQTEGYDGGPALKVAPNTGQSGRYSLNVPMTGGESYRVSVWVKSNVAIPAGSLGIYARSTKVGGAVVTVNQLLQSNGATGNDPIAANTWAKLTLVASFDPAAAFGSFGFFTQTSFATGTVWWSMASATRMGDGQLIVDGSLTAVAIAANAITAEKINANAVTSNKILANAVIAGKIATNAVTAGTIVAGAVTTDKLDALAVTADKIAANTITSNQIDAGSIRAAILTADVITSTLLKSDAITVKHTITAAKYQTTAASNRGLQIDASGLKAWDSTGKQTVGIDAATGFATISGRLRSAMPGQPGVVIVPSSESSDGTTMGVWFAPNVDNIPGQVTGGIWTATLPSQMVNTYQLHLRGANAGGVKVWNNLEIQGIGSLPAQIHGAGGLTLQTIGNQAVDVVNSGYDYTMMHKAFGGAGCYNGFYLNGSHLSLVGAGGRFNNDAGIEALDRGIRLITASGKNVTAPAVYNRTSGAAANVVVGSDGGLWRSTSALKYKAMVAEMALPETLLDVKVKDWRDRLAAERYADALDSRTIGCLTEMQQLEFDSIDISRIPGAIAEEVLEAGGDSFIQYGADGEVEGLMYDRFTLARTQLLNDKLNKAIERIEELEARLNNVGDTV